MVNVFADYAVVLEDGSVEYKSHKGCESFKEEEEV